MNLGKRTYDLTDCDREPIHQIGEIQSFGGLIAVNGDWMIAHRSANCGEILGIEETPEVGRKLNAYLEEAALDRLRETLRLVSSPDDVQRIFGIRLTRDGSLHDVALHCTDALTIIEFEPHAQDEYTSHVAMINPLMGQLSTCRDIQSLCERAVGLLKDMVVYDRVMVYRFHKDGSGEVIAEAREDGLEPYLDLRYPRSDIPQQARELFRRNRFRILADMDAEPVPIEPGTGFDGEPIDLSMSVLRAQSKIHVEYLKNMGVASSLSIAIVVHGKLWGLFACHHSQPRVPPYSLRTVAELFSQFFSISVERLLLEHSEGLRSRAGEIHNKLMTRLAGGAALADSLPLLDQVLADVVPHDGSSVYIDEVYTARGSAPTEEEFMALIPALNGAPTSKVIATEALAHQVRSARSFLDRAAGALILPISRSPRDYLVLWRRQLTQQVRWAGDPEKAMIEDENGVRLSPRKSFAAWEETVAGKSAEWTEDELKIAESLRITLLEVVLRLTDEAMRERSRAQEQQDLLIAELNHRVRNILNLIRGLVAQSKHDASDIADYSDIIGGRINALASAHDNITRQNWSPAPITSLIEAEAEAYLEAKQDRLVIEGEDVLITPEAYTVLALVIHEMVTNSAKYGSLCDRRGRLDIKLERAGNGDLLIGWREKGGPPVAAPTRRGFGSTIRTEGRNRCPLQGRRSGSRFPNSRAVSARNAGGRFRPVEARRNRTQPQAGTAGRPAKVRPRGRRQHDHRHGYRGKPQATRRAEGRNGRSRAGRARYHRAPAPRLRTRRLQPRR